ncbi:hypothetical protein ACSSQN_022780, partial [Raoultella planticola]|uniref:hypothetical protein n=1 Tax=Raoultella planticola TaxID=575 RepID=UPI003FD8910A
ENPPLVLRPGEMFRQQGTWFRSSSIGKTGLWHINGNRGSPLYNPRLRAKKSAARRSACGRHQLDATGPVPGVQPLLYDLRFADFSGYQSIA